MSSGLPTIELVKRTDGDAVVLCAPKVGLWTPHAGLGDAVEAGRRLGELRVLGRRFCLVVPAGAVGVVDEVEARPLSPVEYGQVLVRVGAGGARTAQATRDPAAQAAGGGVPVTAPIHGIFYRRPAPDQPSFVEAGQVIETGLTLGLLEVMKTFHPVVFEGPGLPARARVVSVEAGDQVEVEAGSVLLRVEPA